MAFLAVAACATQGSLSKGGGFPSGKSPVALALAQKPAGVSSGVGSRNQSSSPSSPPAVKPVTNSVPPKAVPVETPDSERPLTLLTNVPDDPSIQLYLDYFRYADHHRFKEWLERSHEYLPYIRKTFEENGLPGDLAYVSLIESGFSTRAYSRTGAAGLWQFMRGTGVKYGLKVNWWIDQRRDPILSTQSAALYLRDLYDEFQSWDLALAAYNAGEGRVANAVARCGTKDYWQIRRTRALSSETRNYIPKLIAAALIAKNPEKYGFTDLAYHPTVETRQEKITHPVEIRQLAHAMNMSVSEFLVYNPQFMRWATPPKLSSVSVNVPAVVSPGFERRLGSLPRTKINPDVPVYRVESGDSLWSIAHRFHVSIGGLVVANRLTSRKHLKLHQKLIIPRRVHRGDSGALLASVRHHRRRMDAPVVSPEGWVDHRIRRGDSLYVLARHYNTSIRELQAKNHLYRSENLRVGQHILIPSH
jgi:membrane-bound lytic murein transglycosylase D